jgi:hypothetical protein
MKKINAFLQLKIFFGTVHEHPIATPFPDHIE